jgi:DmsE family decaheme c-type cytochrome
MEDPSKSFPVIPADLPFNQQGEVCGRCHIGTHQQAMLTTDPHARASLVCTSCHAIHSNKDGKQTKRWNSEACLTCHTNVARQFEMRSAHPLQSGNIKCIDCHDLSGTKDQMLAIGMDWSCQGCHSDKSGPFTYEHPVTSSHLVNGGGCVECHNPHGSNNSKLLNQPESGICLQCHTTPSGHRTQHAGLGTKFACANCHSEIHGSFDNRALLDPNLGTRFFPDCFQSGCHIIGE